MYAGRVVETSGTTDLFGHMRHPYAQSLLASIPQLSQDRNRRLLSIPGIPPDLGNPPSGCRFAARCRLATDECRAQEPALTGPTPEHTFACWHPVDGPLSGAEIDAVVDATGEPQAAGKPASALGVSLADRELPGLADQHAGPLLQIDSLVKEFPVTSGLLQRTTGSVKAVSGVSFEVNRGETFGLVGESGCGKTTIGRMAVALERPMNGSVRLNGVDVASMKGKPLRSLRRDLQLMFQDPYSSLDPRMRVGAIVREPLAIQGIGSRRQQDERVYELLAEVGLPRTSVQRFPHEFSGGQRQRIGLARALTLNPQLIVADEPVSALDVSIRAQVLNLMKRLQRSHGLTYIVISHDLAVVEYMADRIGVMYLGKLVEIGSGADIYQRFAHPYTAGLLAAIPVPEPAAARQNRGSGVKGELPSPVNPPSGCRFRTRCQFAQDICADQEPELQSFGPGHLAACHFPLQRLAPAEPAMSGS
jgi:oligopeptide/dipeptide ABC transporter ATP-binding protein